MVVLAWLSSIVLFSVAFLGLFYPIIPSSFVLILGFLSYGFLHSFGKMTLLFWIIQILFFLLLFGADMLANIVGVQKFGGSRAGIWGSTIGLILGPFVIPVAGILLGPFLGAVLAELVVSRCSLLKALKIGVGSLVGFFTSVVMKGIIMIVMITIFIFFVT